MPGRWAVGSPAAFVGDAMLVNPYGGLLLCFDLATGQVLWRKRKRPGRRGLAWALDDRTALCTTPHLVRLDVRGPRIVWELPIPVVHAVPAGGEVWALTIDEGGTYQFLGVSIETGEVVCRFSYGVSSQRPRDLWQDNGFAPDVSALVASHTPGEVTCLRPPPLGATGREG